MTDSRDAEIGSRMRRRRRECGLTMKQLASALGSGTHFTTVGKLETGKMQFTSDWLHAVASALDMPVAALVNDRFADEAVRSTPLYPNQHVAPFGHPFSEQESIATIPVLSAGTKVFCVLEADAISPDRFAFGHWYLAIDPENRGIVSGGLYALRTPSATRLRFATMRLDPPAICWWPEGSEFEPMGQEPFEIIGRVVYQSRTISPADGAHLAAWREYAEQQNNSDIG